MIKMYRQIETMINDSHKRILLLGQLSMPTTQYLAFEELVSSEIEDVLKLEIQHLLVNSDLGLDSDEDNSSDLDVECNF